MLEENKKLLLVDLCARLPYGFTIHRYSDNCDIVIDSNGIDEFAHFLEYSEGEDFKLYLRSMSSMTEEEKKEYHETKIRVAVQWDDYNNPIGFELISTFKTFDWLNAHHFDFRNLIKRGLAIEAPSDMYKID